MNHYFLCKTCGGITNRVVPEPPAQCPHCSDCDDFYYGGTRRLLAGRVHYLALKAGIFDVPQWDLMAAYENEPADDNLKEVCPLYWGVTRSDSQFRRSFHTSWQAVLLNYDDLPGWARTAAILSGGVVETTYTFHGCRGEASRRRRVEQKQLQHMQDECEEQEPLMVAEALSNIWPAVRAVAERNNTLCAKSFMTYLRNPTTSLIEALDEGLVIGDLLHKEKALKQELSDVRNRIHEERKQEFIRKMTKLFEEHPEQKMYRIVFDDEVKKDSFFRSLNTLWR